MKLSEFLTLWGLRAEYFKSRGHDLFIEYASHVRQVEIRFYRDGWERGKVPDFHTYFVFDEEMKLTKDW